MTYPYDLLLHAEINRNRVYDKVIDALEEAANKQGMTQSKIAAILDRKPSQISAWLSGPSNWTLDTISHLLRSVHATMEYKVVFDADRINSNILHPANLDPDISTIPGNTVSSIQPNPTKTRISVQVTSARGANTWQTTTPKQFHVSGTRNTERYIPIPVKSG